MTIIVKGVTEREKGFTQKGKTALGRFSNMLTQVFNYPFLTNTALKLG